MAIRISFKRGIKQSQQAAQYFRGVVAGLVRSMLDGLQEHKYHISALKGPSLQLRVWSVSSLEQEELHNLMELLMSLRTQIQHLEEEPGGQDEVARLAAGWFSEHMGGADLYVEVAVNDPITGDEQRPEFTLAIVHGRCAMISTDGCLFTWLEEDVFGLTVAGHGSYLLELEPDNSPALRKAS